MAEAIQHVHNQKVAIQEKLSPEAGRKGSEIDTQPRSCWKAEESNGSLQHPAAWGGQLSPNVPISLFKFPFVAAQA